MRNRILITLLVLCLAACLLPNYASAATVSASVTLAGTPLEIKGYDAPAYFANPHTEQSNTNTNPPHAENWNAKLIWHSGEDFPTIYLKGLVVDNSKQTGIVIPVGQPMRIIIREDSQINAKFGILYQSDLEIISEGEAKLDIESLSGAINSGVTTGCALTIDANLDLFVKSYYDASSHILQTNQADLTINGGNIKVRTDDEKSLFGVITRNSGNIVINGGELDVTSSIGAAPANGSIHSSGKLIINNGTVKATAKSSVPLYARDGIEIAGGTVDISSPYYGINAGSPDAPADITINGGTVKIAANRAFFTYPLLGDGVFAYAGADEESAEVYDGTLTALAKEPWMLISNDPSLKIETEPTQAPTTMPTELSTVAPSNAPTEAPATIPTTVPTIPPTDPTTEAPTEAPGNGIEDRLYIPHLLIVLAAAGAMGFVGMIVTLIAFRRKK